MAEDSGNISIPQVQLKIPLQHFGLYLQAVWGNKTMEKSNQGWGWLRNPNARES